MSAKKSTTLALLCIDPALKALAEQDELFNKGAEVEQILSQTRKTNND